MRTHKELQEVAKQILAGESIPDGIGIILICVEPNGPAAYVSTINDVPLIKKVLTDMADAQPEVHRTTLH